MLLDTSTLVTAAPCITGLLGIFLLAIWLQERSVRAMAWWGSAYLIGAAAVAMWGMHSAPTPYLVELPNALLFVACAMIWNGARLFHGRRVCRARYWPARGSGSPPASSKLSRNGR